MDGQDGGQDAGGLSPESAQKAKLQLPMSCDPPGPNNPPKQLVWIVSLHFSLIAVNFSMTSIWNIRIACFSRRWSQGVAESHLEDMYTLEAPP